MSPTPRTNVEPGRPSRVVGLDLSWTGTGMADNRGRSLTFGTKADHPGGKRARLEATLAAVLEFVEQSRPGSRGIPDRPLVLVEAPAFSAKGAAVVDMGGLWWYVTQTLHVRGVPLVPITTGTLKKYATGVGNGGKPPVVAAVARREPDLEVRDDNVPDAIVLRSLGCAVLGSPAPGWENLPARHLEAVTTALKAAHDAGVTLPDTPTRPRSDT